MAMLPAQAPPAREPVHQIRSRRAGSLGRGLAGRSDERLVQIAREGDERAFGVLYERHSAAILRYCRSLLRSAQEAEDVKQEVFVLAISALRRGVDPDSFRPWLYRVAHNACMSHMRVRRPVLVADNGVLVGPAAAAEPVDGHREELRQLLDDIGTLPDVQRGALLLREMDGFSYEQVGEVLGLPPSTVRASIFRARRTLQGLAEARDADCEVIQSELNELADRRGRRARHITSHLHVCSTCRDFRDGLRRRPTVLGAVDPVGPAGAAGALVALKAKLLGGATAGGGAGAALATGAGGVAGVAKMSAVIASSVALLAGAGLEAERVIERSHESGAAAVTRSKEPRGGRAAQTPSGVAAGPSRPGAPAPGGFASREVAPAAGSGRVAPAAGSSPAHTRGRPPSTGAAPRAGAPRAPVSASASADAPTTAAPAPAPTERDAGPSGRDDERGSSGHGRRHGSGRREQDRDRSGSSSDRRDDTTETETARPRVSEPRAGGSSGTGSSQPRDDEPTTPRTPASSSGTGSGSTGSAPKPKPVEDQPSTPEPPGDSGPSAPIPPVVVPTEPGDGDPAPPPDPEPPADPGDELPTDTAPTLDPPADGGDPAADTPPSTP
jgi:RNA polymerase sigma factor (sigma-70 family)